MNVERASDLRREREPGRSWRSRLLSASVGLLLLAALLLASARTFTGGWAAAARHCVGSPYFWLALLVYLPVHLDRHPIVSGPQPGQRRWLTVIDRTGWLLVPFALFNLVSTDFLPDRWYGMAGKALIVVLFSVMFSDGVCRIPGWLGRVTPGTPDGPRQDSPR